MVYHLDRNYDRIGHILQEKTFHTYMDASTTDMMETLFDYFPDTIIRYMRKYAPWMDKIQLDKLAADTSRLADWIDGMKPENKDKTKAMCIRMFEQWNAISLYTLAVRQSYSETVGDDPTRMGEFDGKKLKDLDLASITDPDLLAAVKKPRLDDDISQKIEQWNGDQQELLALWNAAETLEDRREIIQRLLNQIDSV